MALHSRKKITVEGESVINGAVVQGYRAEINSDNPEDITISDWIVDKNGYKENRVQARRDSNEFEDMAYAIQDEMIAAIVTTETE